MSPSRNELSTLLNVTRNIVLADRVQIATSWWARLKGLLGKAHLEPGEALIIPRCNAIHTMGMRFAIDVLFLKQDQIIKIAPHTRPGRLVFAVGADCVIELPAGAVANSHTKQQDVVLQEALTTT